MATYTATISDDNYNNKVKPAIIIVYDYENQKLEGESENQFIKRMTDNELNRWINRLRLELQKRESEVINQEDIFN